MSHLKKKWLLELVSIMFVGVLIQATDFYVDPVNGNINNDGSAAHPWSTLQEVFLSNKIQSRIYSSGQLVVKNSGAPVRAGDNIILRDGYHGDIIDNNYFNEDYVTIKAAAGHTPVVSSIDLSSCAKFKFQGLTFNPLNTNRDYNVFFYISSETQYGISTDCIIDSCIFYSIWDNSGWSRTDWVNNVKSGIFINGNHITVRNCHLKNVYNGIDSLGAYDLVENNLIENFAGDGMRGLGNYSQFLNNTVKNCYVIDDNHTDGFQSWSTGADDSIGTGEVVGIVLRGNTIINYENSNQPFREVMQGIGCFDGRYRDWVIENNLIVVDFYHGLALMGADNCRIANNTIVDLNGVDPGPSWIYVGEHKDGTPSTNCLVYNNITTNLVQTNVTFINNMEISYNDYNTYFTNPSNFDFTLKQGSPAKGAGFGGSDAGAYGSYTDISVPAIPLNLQSFLDGSDISLTWDASQDNLMVKGYNIYRDGNFLASVSTNSYKDVNISTEVNHQYSIDAFDFYGNKSALSTTLNSSESEIVTYPVDLSSGLVKYFKLDNNLSDYSENNGNGTAAGSLSFIQNGNPGGALVLTNTGNAAEISTNSMSISSGSISLWIKPSGFAERNQYIFGHGITDGSSWSDRIQLYFYDSSGNLNLGLGGTHTRANNIQVLNVNAWYHIVLTWDGTNYTVYINNLLKAHGLYGGLIQFAGYADLGNNGNRNGRTEGYNGLLDDVKMYNRAINIKEVEALYNGGVIGADIQQPSAPASLHESSVSATRIYLSWIDNSNNESGFKVERSVNGTDFVEMAQTPANGAEYADSGLTINTTYYYRVKAYNTAGTSDSSNVLQARTSNTKPVITPVSLTTRYQGEKIEFDLNVTDVNIPDNITLEGSQMPEGSTLTKTGARTWRFSWQTDFSDGNTTIRFTANDGIEDSDPVNVGITVNVVSTNLALRDYKDWN